MCDHDMNITKMFNDEEINSNKMLHALSAIALEMQTFHASTPFSYHDYGERQDLSEKFSICKSKLRLKRKQIKLLKHNLRKACLVAKTVMSAKEKETLSLHNDINIARSDCVDLYQKNKTKTETIHNLLSGNEALQEKIKTLEEFIELGYLELQKMRNRCVEKLPPVMKLKEIMVSCGQYYADYSNEYETRLQLEQRNRFLNNKIKILVNNLEGVAEELTNVRHQNIKLQKENAILKNRHMKNIENSSIDVIRYANPFSLQNNVQINNIETNVVTGDHASTFNLTSHLSLVKQLLNSQDFMLQDLKKLSKKLSIEPKDDTASDLSQTSII